MISQTKIDEWLREVEERPSSAALIIQYIARRLSDLSAREEELSAQNIELLSGRKVEEYENRIASLEYQLELLKRQLGGEVLLPADMPSAKAVPQTLSLLLYNRLGQVLRTELEPAQLVSDQIVARLGSDAIPADAAPSLLVTGLQEELLLIFDTGRTTTVPVSQLPMAAAANLDWQAAALFEPGVKEELAAIQPIGRLPLVELCLQPSRKGYVKKMKASFLTAHISGKYIGTGVKLPADKTCGLTLAGKDDLFVMVSQEGFVFSMRADKLPVAIEEVVHLGITDHIVAAFVSGDKPALIFLTQHGKAVHREVSWLEEAASFKSRGQPLLSNARREAGARIVGAAAVSEEDCCISLLDDGALVAQPVRDVLASGSVFSGNEARCVLAFTSFPLPGKSLTD